MEGGYPQNNYSIIYPGRVKQPKNMNSFSELISRFVAKEIMHRIVHRRI